MRLLLNANVYGWRMTGLMPKGARWFFGLSRARRQKKENEIDYSAVQLKRCPFCGFQPRATDDDCIYPVTQDRRLWSLNCYETGGGCAAEVLGDSPEEVIEKWNSRHHGALQIAIDEAVRRALDEKGKR